MPILHGRPAVAEHYKVSEKTVGNWKEYNDFPSKGDDYDTDLIDQFHARHPKLAGLHQEKSPEDEKLHRANVIAKSRLGLAKARREEAAAAEQEIKLQQLQKSLLPRRAVELWIAHALSSLGDRHDQLIELAEGQLPKKLAPKFVKWLQAEMARMRADFADDLKRVPEGDK